MVAIDATASLHELLRRPLGATIGATAASATVASCLASSLPIYTFPERTSKAPTSKIPRVDSIPHVPDFFNEPRCDSPLPLGSVAPFLRPGSASGFSDLPLLLDPVGLPHLLSPDPIPVKHMPYSSYGAAYGADAEPFFGKAAAAAVAAAVKPKAAAGRHLPRRHASDLTRPGSGRGSLDLGSPSEGGMAEVPTRSLLATALMAMWDDKAERGLFRYDVTRCPTRVLPGRHGFVAQLNEGRATKKRPTEFSADRVVQPFDPAKFNFTKAAMTEALLAFQPAAAAFGGGGGAAAVPALTAPPTPLAAALAAAAAEGSGSGGASGAASPHLVVINVSPIDYGHVLLLPRVLDRLPQALDAGTTLLALQFAREMGSPVFRVGYNSLGAFGTINHLHFHTYHLPLQLPCERAATAPLPGRLGAPSVPGAAAGFGDGAEVAGEAGQALLPHKRRFGEYTVGPNGAAPVRVSRLLDYPVNAFVVEPAANVEAGDGADDAALRAVAAVVGAAAERMQAVNQPFNLIVSDAGRRVFVFPQCYAARQAAGVVPAELLDTGVNPASFEIAGHLVLKRKEDYEGADEAWAARLLAAVSLDEERFMSVAAMCFGEGAAGSA